MHRKIMYVAAAGLILLAGALVLRGPDKTEDPQLSSISDNSITKSRGSTRISPESDHPSSTRSSDYAAATNSTSTSESASTSRTTTPPTGNRTTSPENRPGNNGLSNATANNTNAAADEAGTDTEEVADAVLTDTPLPAIRLAQDVQLPAVILALHKEQNDPENKKPQPIKDAMKAIVDTFYQDLAKSAQQGEHVSIDPDGTHVIGKGPAVDRARSHANDVYRAIFGNAAFNQMTMEAVLEAQLPPTE